MDPTLHLLRRMVQARHDLAVRFAAEELRLGLDLINEFQRAGSVESLVSRQHGDLIAAVREAAHALKGPFSVRDIEAYLTRRHGRLMLTSSRKSVSSALRRLREDFNEISRLKKGRGAAPDIYELTGKEATNGQVQR